MRTISKYPRAVGVVSALVAVIVTSACGSDGTSSSPTASTVTVTQSGSSSTAQTEPAAPDPAAGATDTAAPGTTAPPAPASDGAPIMRVPKDANVNAQDFYARGPGVNGYFFQSPTSNVRCGIGLDDPQHSSGCQTQASVRSTKGVTCRNDAGSEYATLLISGAAVSRCVNQPFFIAGSGNPDDGPYGGKVLEYGQIIAVDDTTCESTRIGISCWGMSVGFTLSRDRNDTYDPGYGLK